MGLMERLREIAKLLPENELAEAIGFAETLKASRGLTWFAVYEGSSSPGTG